MYRKSTDELWQTESVNKNISNDNDKFYDSIIKMVNVYMSYKPRKDFINKPIRDRT